MSLGIFQSSFPHLGYLNLDLLTKSPEVEASAVNNGPFFSCKVKFILYSWSDFLIYDRTSGN